MVFWIEKVKSMKYTVKAIAPPSKQEILLSQKDFRVVYPPDYIDFLGENNGGVPIRPCFDTTNKEKMIDRFLPHMDDPRADPVHGQYAVGVVWSQIFDRMAETPDQIGSQLVPIATTVFGDMVCLDFRKKSNAPEIVVWYHDQSRELKPVTEKIADSFTEFLGKLQPLEPYKGTAAS
jgi:SMI1-KNR4 cell-wall